MYLFIYLRFVYLFIYFRGVSPHPVIWTDRKIEFGKLLAFISTFSKLSLATEVLVVPALQDNKTVAPDVITRRTVYE